MKIAIVIIATNQYFPLGIRFVKRFSSFYRGTGEILFSFFTDVDPSTSLPESINYKFYHEQHNSWQDGTNSKFKNILTSIEDSGADYTFYFDADTNVNQEFDDWFVQGDLVGGEHFGNRSFLSNGKGFDRNPRGKSYVPIDSPHPYTYHYGAFFGGRRESIHAMCSTLLNYQQTDQAKGYEPPVNDESYINHYFHYNPPFTVRTEDFKFVVSDKGGVDRFNGKGIRAKDSSPLTKDLPALKYDLFNIQNGKIVDIKKDYFK